MKAYFLNCSKPADMLKTLIYLFAAAVIMASWMAKPFIISYFTGVPPEEELERKDFIVVGHRGAAGHAPENTMASFRKALELGADWIELDVHLSKDGHLIVMHDATVDRTTNGSGAIAGFTYAELRQLDAGSWYSEDFAGEKVPVLAEVIRTVSGQARLLIELKWPEQGLYDRLGERVAQEVRKYGAESWCVIQSFESAYLKEAAATGYSIPLQKLLVAKTSLLFMPMYQDNRFHMGNLPIGKEISSVNYFHKALTAGIVEDHHEAGKLVIPYTLNTREAMVKVLGMGVDGIITDYPDIAKQLKADLQQGL